MNVTGQNSNFGQGTSTTTAWLQQNNEYIFFTTMNVVNNVMLSGTVNVQVSSPIGFYDVNVYNNIDGSMTLPNVMT